MPRPLERRPLDLTSLSGHGDAAAQFVARSGHSFPADPKLLTDISRALLIRMKRISPKDAALAFWIIRVIAAYEDMKMFVGQEDSLPGDIVQSRATRKGLLNLLANEKIPKGTHWAPIVQIQRNKMMLYLDVAASDRVNDPYPEKARNPALRRIWLRKHEKHLLPLLAYPCSCHYTASGKVRERSLQAIANENVFGSRSITRCTTRGQLILLTLSEWHGVGVKRIEKLWGPKLRR